MTQKGDLSIPYFTYGYMLQHTLSAAYVSLGFWKGGGNAKYPVRHLICWITEN